MINLSQKQRKELLGQTGGCGHISDMVVLSPDPESVIIHCERCGENVLEATRGESGQDDTPVLEKLLEGAKFWDVTADYKEQIRAIEDLAAQLEKEHDILDKEPPDEFHQNTVLGALNLVHGLIGHEDPTRIRPTCNDCSHAQVCKVKADLFDLIYSNHMCFYGELREKLMMQIAYQCAQWKQK